MNIWGSHILTAIIFILIGLWLGRRTGVLSMWIKRA